MKASKEEKLEIESASEWKRSKIDIDNMILNHQGWTLNITVVMKKKIDKVSKEQLEIFTKTQV